MEATESVKLDIEATAAEVDRRLREHTDPERRRHTEQSYCPSAMQILGVATPALRKVVRQFKETLKYEEAKVLMALAHRIVAYRTLEGRQVAYELLAAHKAASSSLGLEELEALGRGIDNWASADGFSVYLAGPAWREGRLSGKTICSWARSTDRWWRRVAVVSTVPLNLKSRGGTGDPERTLRICRLVAADRDDMVVKGLSWALRELAKREPSTVERFLSEHDDVLAPRVKREVRRKLQTGRK